jgi:hypothetical protein
MRPYLVLCALVLVSLAAFGQQPVPSRIYGPCYGCGPFIPLVTTPMISLETVSPNPVGASNATTGLVAGATNSTLSEVSGNTSSVYTEPVWYQGGGAPLVTPAVHLHPEPVPGEGHHFIPEHAMAEHAGEKPRSHWTYMAGAEHTASAADASSAARAGKKAVHSYGNADVERQNQNNGNVKYNGKSEKL